MQSKNRWLPDYLVAIEICALAEYIKNSRRKNWCILKTNTQKVLFNLKILNITFKHSEKDVLMIKQEITMDPCRVCLNTKDTKAMDASIYSLFSDCLGLELDANEIVNLCWGCRSKLLEFNEFKKLAQNNSAYFLTQIKCEVDVPEMLIKSTDDLKESLAIALPIIKHEVEQVDSFKDNDDYSYSSMADDHQERTQSDVINKKLMPRPKKRGKYKKKPK